MVQPHGSSGVLRVPLRRAQQRLHSRGCCSRWVPPCQCASALPLVQLCLHRVMPKHF